MLIPLPKTIIFNTKYQQTIKFEEGANAVSAEHQISYNEDNAGYNYNKSEVKVFRFLFEPRLSIRELRDGNDIEYEDSRQVNILVSEKGIFKDNVFNFSTHPEFEDLLIRLLEENNNTNLLKVFKQNSKTYEFIIVLDSLDLLNLGDATLGNIESGGRDRSRVRRTYRSRSRDRSRVRRTDRSRSRDRSRGGKTKKNKRKTVSKKRRSKKRRV